MTLTMIPGIDHRPISLPDKAHRRMKVNVRAVTSLLRLDSSEPPHASTETVLAEMRLSLLGKAAFHKALCRSGSFEQIDLAVYLSRIATLMNAPARPHNGGGWSIDLKANCLTWIGDPCDIHRTAPTGLPDLQAALAFVPQEWREIGRHAVCACATLAPPSVFRWMSPQHGARRCDCPWPEGPGEVSMRLRTTDNRMIVDLCLSEHCLGLPRPFDGNLQRSLGLDLASILAGQLHDRMKVGPEREVLFRVTFAPTHPQAVLRH